MTSGPISVADMRGRLEKWRRDVGAQGNAANPHFNGKLWAQLYRDVDPSRLRELEGLCAP